MIEATCAVCGDSFEPRRGGRPQIYCGASCRRRADYQRNGTPAIRGKRSEYYSRRWWEEPEYRATLLAAARDRHLRRKYGVGVAVYNELLQRQGGRCAICGAEESVRRSFDMDHDHESGRVRGLLCARCNPGIGYFQDDPGRLRAAADYLERNR